MKPIYYFIEYVVNNIFPLNEYSEGEIRYLIDKFKEEADDFNIEISDEELKKSIERFDQLKNSPNIKEKNLRKYSLKQLLKIVKSVPSGDTDEEDITPDVVYNENGLIIYSGHKEGNCVKYGSGEKWCITQTNFPAYRYGDYETTFYLVKDTNKEKTAEDSFFVIHVLNNGSYKWTGRSNSPGESEITDWSGIENAFPVLRGLQSIFKYIPLSNKEKTAKKLGSEGITFRKWATDLDLEEKKAYMVKRRHQDLFTDIDLDTFLKKLPSFDKIAEFISKNPYVLKNNSLFTDNITFLLEIFKNFDVFKPNYQKSILANVRSKIDPKILYEDKYPFSVKKMIVQMDKLSSNKTLYYIHNDDIIVRISTYPNISIDLIGDDFDYKDIKLNSRTQKYLFDYPDLDKISLLKLKRAIYDNNLTIDKEKLKKVFPSQEIDGREVILDKNNLQVYSLDDLKSIEGGSDILIPFVNQLLNDPKNQNILHQKLITGQFDKIDYEIINKIYESIPEDKRKINNTVLYKDDSGIYVFWDPTKFTPNTNPISVTLTNQKSIIDPVLDLDLLKKEFEAYRAFNIGLTDEKLKDILENTEVGRTLQQFIQAEPPMARGSKYIPKIINNIKVLYNTVNPRYSEAYTSEHIPGRRGRRGRNVLKWKQFNASEIQPAAAQGVHIGAGRRGRPVGGGVPAAPVPQAALGQETVAQVLRTNDIYADTTNLALSRIFQAPAEEVPVYSDRGASRRDRVIRNGRVTKVLRVGQSAVYIIEFNNGHKIASVAIQPNALHFICFEDRIQQIQRANELEQVLQGLNLEEQKYIIKEFLMKKLNLI